MKTQIEVKEEDAFDRIYIQGGAIRDITEALEEMHFDRAKVVRFDEFGLFSSSPSGLGFSKILSHSKSIWDAIGMDIMNGGSVHPLVLLAGENPSEHAEAFATIHDRLRQNFKGSPHTRLKLMSFNFFLKNVTDIGETPALMSSSRSTALEVIPPERPQNRNTELQLNADSAQVIEIVASDTGAGTDVAFVKLRASIGEQILIVEGTAKRDPRDRPDEEIALTLATARALASLARKLERRALGRIKHNEDTIEIKRGQRAARVRQAADAKALGLRRASRRRDRALHADKGDHGHTSD